MTGSIQLLFAVAIVGSTILGAALPLLPSTSEPVVPEVTPFVQAGDRGFTRIVWFSDDKSNPIAGEFWIDYGRPPWKGEYAKAMDAPAQKRWRLGSDAWTTLDTHVEITVGGQKVAPGAYYVVLERPDKEHWNLVLLDPAPLRAAKFDAFGASATTGGILIPMTHAKADKAADKLAIAITSDKAKKKEGTIEISFGPHKLTTRFVGGV